MKIKQFTILLFTFFCGQCICSKRQFSSGRLNPVSRKFVYTNRHNTTYPSASYAWQITSPTGVISNYSGNDTIGIVLSSSGHYDE